MTENELIDEIRDYVHNIHKAEPFHGFSFRELREVGEHFALPREKQIEELEKENADLKEEINKIAFARGNLEEENAELKSDNTEWERASDKWKSVYELTNNQLTKAKEIIKDLLIVYKQYNQTDTYIRAERFLKE